MSGTSDDELAARAARIARDGFGGVVVGFDGSPASRSALLFAGGLASRGGGGELVVVLVGEANPVWAVSPGAAVADVEADHELAQVLRADTANQLDRLGVRWRFERRDGDAAEQLLAVGRETGADLVVVGRSSGGLAERVRGSVVTRLTRDADRPVLVVP